MHHGIYLQAQRDFMQPLHTGRHPQCVYIATGSVTPHTPREGPAARHEPYSSPAAQGDAGHPPFVPSLHPLASLGLGGRFPGLGWPPHPSSFSTTALNEPGSRGKQGGYFWMRVFCLNTKQKHMQNPHIHPHSAQRWVLHFTCSQYSEIPGWWGKQMSLYHPIHFHYPPQHPHSYMGKIKCLSSTELSLPMKQAKPEERAEKVLLTLLQCNSRWISPLSACLLLSLLPKSHQTWDIQEHQQEMQLISPKLRCRHFRGRIAWDYLFPSISSNTVLSPCYLGGGYCFSSAAPQTSWLTVSSECFS